MGSAHYAADSYRAGRICHHAHIFFELALNAVKRANFFSRTRAAHHDAAFVQLVEVEGVQWMTQLEHHVVRYVHHVVDGFLVDRFQALPQPVRRGLYLHSSQHARCEASAKIGRFDFNASRGRRLFRGFFQFRLHRFERQSINSSSLARDSQVAQAIRPVRRDFRVEHRPRRGLFDRIHGDAAERQARAQVLCRRLHVHEFLQPVVENLHLSRVSISLCPLGLLSAYEMYSTRMYRVPLRSTLRISTAPTDLIFR